MRSISMIKVAIFLWSVLPFATSIGQTYPPYWANKTQLPAPSNKTFYYEVTEGEGFTQNKAFDDALNNLGKRLSLQHGGAYTKADEENNTLQFVFDGTNIKTYCTCTYIESSHGNRGYHIYVLWQIALNGMVEPRFDLEFNKCR